VLPNAEYRLSHSVVSAAGRCPLLLAWRDGRTLRRVEERFARRDGTLVHVACSLAPLRSGTSLRGGVVVFRDASGEVGERVRRERELEELSWVGRTREAMDEGRLVLYSQPIRSLIGGPDREELLARLITRSGEVVLPRRFLPAAERYGLIGAIDELVIGEAVRIAAGGRHVHANLSASSIGRLEVLTMIEGLIAEHGADPSRLTFELTETALVEDLDQAELFARRLADIGCGLALDDFGTGYASFLYLKRLPFSAIKIDTEFVSDIATSAANLHVVRATVSLAQAFGKLTVAEGVEDATTLGTLAALGVDYVQGHHLGRPLPLEEGEPEEMVVLPLRRGRAALCQRPARDVAVYRYSEIAPEARSTTPPPVPAAAPAEPCRDVVLRMDLPPEQASPAMCRRWLRSNLAGEDQLLRETVVFLCSEVVTNAVLFAGTQMNVEVRLAGGGARVEVCDENPVLPAHRGFDTESLSGRGLLMLDSLASSWGAEMLPGGAGKVVWFKVGRPTPPAEREPEGAGARG